MAPGKKRQAKAKGLHPVKSKTQLVEEALSHVEDLSERVKDMLCGTLSVTVGQQKGTRHPFNERLVTMIGEVLDGHHKALKKDVADKQLTFDQLTPTKGTREAALQSTQASVGEKTASLDHAKHATAENLTQVKEAAVDLENKNKEQAAGDEELAAITSKKDALQAVRDDSLQALLQGTVADEERAAKVADVVAAGRSFAFDASLMQAVVQVLEKDKSERTGFDETCTEQMRESFASKLQEFEDQLTTGAQAKAERQAALDAAEAAKQAAEAKQAELVQEQAAAKEAKEAAVEAAKSAKKSLQDFMPELKNSGDSLDEAKQELEEFATGALAAYTELKDWKEGDFDPAPAPVAAAAFDHEPYLSVGQEGSPAKKARTEGE